MESNSTKLPQLLLAEGTGLPINFTAAEILQYVRALSPEKKATLLQELKETWQTTSEEQFHCFLYELGQCNLNDTMHIPIYEESLWEYSEYRIHKNMLLYIPPIILFFGTVGNILSFVILTRKPMNKQSTYRYLAALSITDTLVLYIGLLRIWVRELTGYDPQQKYGWSCGLITVLAFTVSDYSVWLIIAVTVERYIAVCWPLRAPALCNNRKAFRVMFGILFILLCINMHFLWTTEVKSYHLAGETITKCEDGLGFEKVVTDIWPWVDAFIYSYIPVVIISIFNGLIIQQVILSKRERRLLYGERVEVRRGTNGSRRAVTTTQRSQSSSTSEGSMKVTIMLLTISFAFLITTLPMNSMLIANALLGELRQGKRIALLKMIRSITELLMYLNHSMNFFLYCATGEKFRQQLVALFRPRRPRPNTIHMDTLQNYKHCVDRPTDMTCIHSQQGQRAMTTVTYSPSTNLNNTSLAHSPKIPHSETCKQI